MLELKNFFGSVIVVDVQFDITLKNLNSIKCDHNCVFSCMYFTSYHFVHLTNETTFSHIGTNYGKNF